MGFLEYKKGTLWNSKNSIFCSFRSVQFKIHANCKKKMFRFDVENKKTFSHFKTEMSSSKKNVLDIQPRTKDDKSRGKYLHGGFSKGMKRFRRKKERTVSGEETQAFRLIRKRKSPPENRDMLPLNRYQNR